MIDPAFLWVHKPPNFWLKIGAFNLAMAIIVGTFFGIAARALLVVFIDWKGGRGIGTLRAMKGAVFLLLGGLYTLFAWPMLDWDHPARFLAVITIVLPPLVAGIRRSREPAPGPPKLRARLLGGLLMLVLLATAMLTLLRAGFITLEADRVPLLLEITGEAKSETISLPPPSGVMKMERAHRVILWMPDGRALADLWIGGDRVAFAGRAVLFSSSLNSIGFPNLYQFLTARSTTNGGGQGDSTPFSMNMPHTGRLAVHPWWQPIQAAILRIWPRATTGGFPFWATRIVQNQSPFYPLTGKDGQPLKGRFLLDIMLDGIPTSRGSSPFETR
jgi:hypothetical protein